MASVDVRILDIERRSIPDGKRASAGNYAGVIPPPEFKLLESSEKSRGSASK